MEKIQIGSGRELTANMRVRRYNPETDKEPWWGEYTLEGVSPTDSVLDLLHQIKWTMDGSLALRRSCAHGVCGSDAMRINGANALACKVLVARLGNGTGEVNIQVEPMLGLPVLKDLIVDMEPFFDHYKEVLPYFVNDEPPPADGRERLQSPADRAKFDDTTKCILCAACTTACPSFWADDRYVGPAAIVQAHRFIYDSRDQAYEERLEIMAEQFGVWRCRTIFNCTNACPRDIEVTKAIAEVKMSITTGKV
ncbi:MAG TPA: succinate dehydrogenase iron-sulfur subunit [Candidatus Sulfomarinibacteraceae bacterium]|nr:succinate dehydrogenase iron-sulfur subunit [Candidatus Sulfomarinibacteraceae bacterium]